MLIFMLCFYGLFLLNESEDVRGKTIRQDKMLHGHHPLADLLGQISRSNDGSKLSVEFVGRICRSNCWSNSRIKFTGRIAGSNPSVKFLDQIPRSNLLVKSAGQTQAILGPTLASLGARMAMPSNGPKTGKDGWETGKEKGHALRAWPWLAWL
jgi:hypothetical protein